MRKYLFASVYIVALSSCTNKPNYNIVGTWQQLGYNDNLYYQFTETFNNGLWEKRWQTFDKDKKLLGDGIYRIEQDTIWTVYYDAPGPNSKDSAMLIIREYKENEFIADYYVHGWNFTLNTRSFDYDETIKLQKTFEYITAVAEKSLTSNQVIDTSPYEQTIIKSNEGSENKNYYSLGSSEQEVLNIQGEPNSIYDATFFKIYTYGMSSVTFKNGVVKSFSNNGNLKIKIALNNSPAEEEIIKYVYYTFNIAKVGLERDSLTNEIRSKIYVDGYSSIFQIKKYDVRKETILLLCLEDAFEIKSGLPVLTSPHTFDSKEAAFIYWNREKGILFEESTCQEPIK